MPEQKNKFINIGRITKAHGVRGEMVLDFYSEDADLLDGTLFLGLPERTSGTTATATTRQPGNTSGAAHGSRPVRINSVRWHHGKPLITIEGVKDRTEAELLRNCPLFIPESALPELSDGELYIHTIIGLKVYVMGIELPGMDFSQPIGELAWVDQSAGQEIWGIVTPEGKEILFPAVDEFIVNFDMENESVRIAPPEGLLELYLTDQS